LAENEKEILECQDNLQNIKTHATDLQTFLGLKQIEHEITKNERFVQSLSPGIQGFLFHFLPR
jgi:hypothetical protein